MELRVVPVTPFQQNCSIVCCKQTGKGAVVDPGGDLERVLAACDEAGVELEKILLTHAHIDHAGATARLARERSLPIEGPHREDDFLIQSLPLQGQMFGIGGDAETFTPDRWLADGDEVTVGHIRFEVRHCPGHTPGHVIFYTPEHRIAIVGDVIFDGSIGRTDLPRGDHATLLRSIADKLLTLDDDVTFLPGHGPASTIGAQRHANPYLQNIG